MEPCPLRADLDRVKEEIPKYEAWISTNSWDTWRNFLNNIDMQFFSMESLLGFTGEDWDLDGLNERQPESQGNAETEVVLNNELANLFATERASCNVSYTDVSTNYVRALRTSMSVLKLYSYTINIHA